LGIRCSYNPAVGERRASGGIMKPRIAPSGLRSRYIRGAYDDPTMNEAGLLDAPFAPRAPAVRARGAAATRKGPARRAPGKPGRTVLARKARGLVAPNLRALLLRPTPGGMARRRRPLTRELARRRAAARRSSSSVVRDIQKERHRSTLPACVGPSFYVTH